MSDDNNINDESSEFENDFDEDTLRFVNDLAKDIEAYEKYLETLDDADYVINKVQYSKFIQILEYLEHLREVRDGVEVSVLEIQPRRQKAEIVVSFYDLNVWDEEAEGFGNAMQNAGDIEISAKTDGKVYIIIQVFDIFVPKE